MSTINNNGNPLNAFQQINKQNAESSTVKETSQAGDDSQMFMKLMIAQLQNQDPTSPADTADFMQNISSMQMVENIDNLVNSVEAMSASMLNSQAALQASAMVGREAFVKTDKGILPENGEVRGLVSLPASASNVTINVYDLSGNQVDSVQLGRKVTGEHEFTWSGGDRPAGEYRFVAGSQIGDESVAVDSYMGHIVNSVSLGQNGIGMKVNTDAGSVGIDDVRQIGRGNG